MDIIWHGYSCFTIKTKEASVLVNPYGDKAGLKLPKTKADIVVVTGSVDGNDKADAAGPESYKIDWPGEYEVKGIAVTALPNPEGKGFFFNLIGEGMKICLMENVGKDLGDELIDKIGDVDILLLAVGGNGVMSADDAHKVIEEIEPRSVVPMYYSVDGASAKLDPLDPFLKLAGVNNSEAIEKLNVTGKASFKEDQTEYFILKPQTA